MSHGLSDATVAGICGVFTRFPAIERAVLYGSRAKGNFKPGSDIDLSLVGENLTPSHLGGIAEALDDLLLPYTFDLSIFERIENVELRDHIQRVGRVFYERKKTGEPERRGRQPGGKQPPSRMPTVTARSASSRNSTPSPPKPAASPPSTNASSPPWRR